MLKTRIYTLVAFLSLSLFIIRAPLLADEPDPGTNKPFGVFFALHMEAGRKAPGLEFQEVYWPRLVDVISLADRYDAKFTLMFNPQWAEYIVMDQDRLQTVNAWQQNGHEIGLHYHLVTHGDWNGYTNRTEHQYTGSPLYKGAVKDMMDLMEQLADTQPVVTACSGPDIVTLLYPFTHPVSPGFIDEVDFPNEIIFDIDGTHDGLTRPIRFEYNGQVRYHLRHGVAIAKEHIQERMQEIESAEPDEIVGLVTHESDCDPVLLESLFQRLGKMGIQVQTVRHIMRDYLDRFEKIEPETMSRNAQPE